MSILNELAYFQGEQDESANIELAKRLVQNRDQNGITEIINNLGNKNKTIQNNCIKVLYEVGEIAPELIEDHVDVFLQLLHSKNNRLVWGAMTALSTFADRKAAQIFARLDEIFSVLQTGSVITIDNGIKNLAILASASEEYNHKIFPYLITHLKKCRTKEVPQHAEKISIAVNSENKSAFIDVLQERLEQFSPAQLIRIKRILKKVT